MGTLAELCILCARVENHTYGGQASWHKMSGWVLRIVNWLFDPGRVSKMVQSNNPELILLKGTQRIVVDGLAPWGGC